MKLVYFAVGIVATMLLFAVMANNMVLPVYAQSAAGDHLKAIGTIANVQMDNGTPAWVLSGGWKFAATLPSDGDDADASANFVASFRMVMPDGNAMHGHKFYDFALSSWSITEEAKKFTGTMTATLKDGPKAGVPVTLTIMNNGMLTIEIDSKSVDHFGTGVIYGPVMRIFDDTDGRASQGTVDRISGTADMHLEMTSVNYYGNAMGYLVYPTDTDGKLPAVVMIHEWWGLNSNIKNMAELLAKEGYVVLAVDMYDGKVATESEQAATLASSVRDNPGPAMENLNAAVAHLSSLPNVDSSKISSLGWCFGGGQSLQLALNTDKPLAATILYYGNLVTDKETISKISWPVLGIFGSADQSIPVETVQQFESALEANNITKEIYIYEGVGHAFANPSGDNYAEKEAADAWQKTLAFLAKHA